MQDIMTGSGRLADFSGEHRVFKVLHRRAVSDALPQSLAITPLPLQKNFSWSFAGNLLYAASQWGMLVVLAKLGSPEMLGQFALGFAITAPVIMFTNLQLRAVQATDAKHQYLFGNYLALRLITTMLGLVVIAGITIAVGYRRETTLVVLTVGLAKAFESVSDVFYGLWQKQERLDRMAIAMTGRGVGSLVTLAAVLYVTRNIVLSVGALAVWWGVWLLTYERSIASRTLALGSVGERFRPAFEPRRLLQLAWLAFPLGPVMFLISLNTNVPRYFVEHYLGEAALGYFAAMAYILVAGNTVTGAFGQSAAPRLARYFHSDRDAFVRLLLKMVLLATILGAGGVVLALLAGRPLLMLLYRPEYAQYARVFAWIMVAGAISYVSSMFGYCITAARMFRVQLPLSAAVTGTTVLGCWILVPRLGLQGAAYALLAAAMVSCVSKASVTAVALRGRPSPG